MAARPVPKKAKPNPRAAKGPHRKTDDRASEQRKGILAPFVFGLLAAIIVALILMFLCQNGLHWTDRCNCSWERVILYSVLAFVACVLQLFPYLSYRGEKRTYTLSRTPLSRKKFEQKQNFLVFGVTIILALAAVLVFFMLIPLFQDQNGNFLWFFTRGGGILAVVATLLFSIGAGLFGKLFLTEYVG